MSISATRIEKHTPAPPPPPPEVTITLSMDEETARILKWLVTYGLTASQKPLTPDVQYRLDTIFETLQIGGGVYFGSTEHPFARESQ